MTTQRIIGVILFLMGLSLGFVFNLFASDSDIKAWYNEYRIWVVIIAALFILVGIVLTIFRMPQSASEMAKHSSAEIPTESNSNGSGDIALLSEDTEFLKEQFAKHKQNLQNLLRQKSNYGAGEVPLRLLNQIDEEEKNIRKIAEQLNQ